MNTRRNIRHTIGGNLSGDLLHPIHKPFVVWTSTHYNHLHPVARHVRNTLKHGVGFVPLLLIDTVHGLFAAQERSRTDARPTDAK